MTAIALTDDQLAIAKAMAHLIGESVRVRRQARHQTIEELALSLGMHPTTVSRVERGDYHNIKIGTVMKLLNAFGLTLAVRPRE